LHLHGHYLLWLGPHLEGNFQQGCNAFLHCGEINLVSNWMVFNAGIPVLKV
jgi:hypothetical protein